MTLLERQPVLDRLHDQLDEARNERGKAMLIHGEAGIGKTTVVRAFTESHESDAHILWAGCDDLLATRPLGPIWDLADSEPTLEMALEREDRLAVFRSVVDLLQRALRPTVLVIEDVHWADDASLDLIKYVGRRIDRTHGLLVLTYRDDLTTDHPLRRVLGDLPQEHLERLQLLPLSKVAVGQLVGDEVRVEHVWKISGGNPFYVTELAGSEAEALPESIRDSIRTRWSRLNPPARDLVELVSVAPSRLRIAVIQDILGDVTDLITECVASGILEVLGESLRFRHELARQAMEQGLDEIRRRELNRLVLEASEALGEDLTRCAHHARQAQDEDAMLRLLPKAAQHASDLDSHREALSHLRALRPYLGRMTSHQLADHYQLWAWEEHWQDPPTANAIGEEAVAVARIVGDPIVLGRALVVASRIKWVNTQRDEAVSLAEEAAETLREVGGEDLATAYATLSGLAMLASNRDEAFRWAELALTHADEGPSYARGQALVNRGTMAAMLRFPEGVEDLEEAYQLGTKHGFPLVTARAVMNLGDVALDWRRLDLAEPWIRLGIELSKEREWNFYGSFMVSSLARMAEMRGDWAEAQAITRRVLDERSSQTIPEVVATTVQARLSVRKGNSEAAGLVTDAWERAKRNDEIQWLAAGGAVIAEYAWLVGGLGEDMADEMVSVLRRCIELELFWYGGDLAQYLALQGAINEVPAVFPSPYVALDRGDWEEAAEFWKERGLPYERAVALSRGTTEAKLEGLELLDGLGAKALATLIRQELLDAGLTGIPRGPYTATREHPLRLTPRQTEVLQLLNEDLTNEEIANRLFVSIRTVENHVSAILTKLNVSDRREAVELAREAQALS